MIERLQFINGAEPPTPEAGTTFLYVDATTKRLRTKDDTGAVVEYSGEAVIPSFSITVAGLASVIGDYSPRGLWNGNPYWNLEGFPDNPNVAAIKGGNGSKFFIVDSDGANAYESQGIAQYPDAVTWSADESGNPPMPTVVRI